MVEENLAEYDGVDQVISSYELKNKFKNEPPLEVVKSKLFMLDSLTGGFSDGNLVVVTGATKCGKTSFCQTLTRMYAMQGIGCTWFTYEVGPREFLTKFPYGQIPLFYLPEVLQETSLTWIEKRIVESKKKFGAKIVFIDHLHFLVPMSTQNMSILIGGVMRELKKMAVRNDVVIFILAHTVKIKSDEKPSLEHLRDSSFVSQESDFVLIISRPPLDEDDPASNLDTSAKLRVAANRRTGKRGVINMTYEDNLYKELK